MSNDTPRNSLSMLRKSKMLELEKANADLISKNNEYENVICQLRRDMEMLKSQSILNQPQQFQSQSEQIQIGQPNQQHEQRQHQTQQFQQTQHQAYQTDEDELEFETGRFNHEDQEWTQVKNKKKRLRESPNISQPNKKQNKPDDYWLGKENSNRYEILENPEESQDNTDPVDQPCKPPPIFVDKVENIQPLLSLLNQHVDGQYDIKTLNNNLVKITPRTIDSYKTIVSELDKKKTEFYTYKPKNERGFKVVMRGMHPSTDIETIKQELKNIGHEVTNIWNIWNKTKNIRYPLFEIELKSNTNNKDIYAIRELMYCKISFEPPKPKKTPPQCSNCQQYGHTRSFCRRPPKCIKCAGNHSSKMCERQKWGNQVKCALCSGNHPANYKGCKVFKQINGLQSLPGRTTNNNPVAMTRGPANTTGEKTYANITRVNHENSQEQFNQNRQHVSTTQTPIMQDIPQMLNMLHQLMQQMTNIIVNITSRISQNGN